MFGTKSATTEKQLSEIEKLGQQEFDLTKKKQAKVAELARAESTAGEAYLNGSGDAAVGDVLRLQAEVGALDRAVALLRERRPAILRLGFFAEAQALRRQADDAAGRLRALTDRTTALLSNLAQLEGCSFTPAGTPKSSTLELEIADLRQRAAALDEKKVPAAGEVDLSAVTSADEVVQAVITHASLTPTIERILAWLDGCEVTAAKYRGARFESHPRRVRIVWDADGIRSDSYIFCGALAAKRKGNFGDANEVLDVSSGTFRPGAEPRRMGDVPHGNEPRPREGYLSERRA